MADRVLGMFAWGAALVVVGALAWLLADVVRIGAPELRIGFLLETPRDAGRAGGIASVLVSTLGILLVCLAAALPLGLGTAILLAEITAGEGLLARFVRGGVDILAGVPSIVFGLFGNAFFCVFLGLGFSILAGGLTLACMVLPMIVRSAEASLTAVSADLRHAAAALGLGRLRTFLFVLLPASLPGLTAGVVLGIGRALAETAALIFTSGYVDRMPASWLDSGRALSVHIYDLAMNVAGGEPAAYGTALVLVLMLLGVNLMARWIGEHWLAGRLERA